MRSRFSLSNESARAGMNGSGAIAYDVRDIAIAGSMIVYVAVRFLSFAVHNVSPLRRVVQKAKSNAPGFRCFVFFFE